jgi:hypothetical protein
MRVVLGLTGAVVLALLALAAPAGAARTEIVRMPNHSPKLVMGGDVVFLSRAPGETRVIHAAAGQSPTEIDSLDDPAAPDEDCCSQQYDVSLEADGSHAAVSRHLLFFAKGVLAEDSFRIDAGLANAKLSELYSCSGNHPFDVNAGRIAYVDGCVNGGGSGSPIVVRDLTASGAPVVDSVPVSGTVTSLDMAGQNLAFGRVAGNTVETVVHDLGTDSESYKVAEGELVSVQLDGKLLQREQAGQGCRLAWYSKADPAPHRIDVCPIHGAKMAGDRIALGRAEGSGARIELRTLDGQATTVASFGASGLLTGFDFDGSSVAYGVRGCSSSQDALYRDDLAGPPPPTEAGPCPATISKSRVRASSSGLVRVGFKCPSGCSGFFSLRRDGKQVVRSVDFFDESPGSGRALMRLNGSTLRLLRQRGSLVVQARLTADQRGPADRTFKRAIRLLEPK